MTIPSVVSRDEQYYTCKASNEHVSLSAKTVIVVRNKCEYCVDLRLGPANTIGHPVDLRLIVGDLPS